MLGEALRLLRVLNDKKLSDLAKAFDISPSYLSEVENDKKKPNFELLESYSKYFGVRPSAILFFAEEIDSRSLSGKAKHLAKQKMIRLLQIIESGKPIYEGKDL